MSALGFHVWNPAGRLPTYVHPTLESALDEAERLTRCNPGQRFVVMAPVLSADDATRAKAWSDGKKQGYADATDDVMKAEAISDRLYEEKAALERTLRQLQTFKDRAAPFQAIVADCLLWFDGFAAAHSPKESWERPHVPDRERMRRLNEALQALLPDGLSVMDLDQEIPF